MIKNKQGHQPVTPSCHLNRDRSISLSFKGLLGSLEPQTTKMTKEAAAVLRVSQIASPQAPAEGTGGQHNKRSQGTLISQQWHIALPVVLLFYSVLQAVISSQSHVCSIMDAQPFSQWTHYVNVAVAACFMLSFFHHTVVAIFLGSSAEGKMNHPKSVYLAAATLSLIAGTSTIISISRGYGPVCIDALGVETFQNQWPEWLAAAPFLGYITISIEDKPALDYEDILIIVCMFLTIFFGFVINFLPPGNVVAGYGLFILSSLGMGGNIFMAIKSDRDRAFLVSAPKKLNAGWQIDRLYRKSRLAWLLVALLPSFAIVYILRYVNVIDRDLVIVGNMIFGMCTKLFFVSILSLEALSVQINLEKRANDSRQQFLRYVFHEVRVPLNTITMGLSVLENECLEVFGPNSVPLDALMMMTGAAGFMNDTLNDVLSMSKIEDGSMTLTMQSFKLDSMVSGALVVIQGQARAKDINIVVDSSASLSQNYGALLTGDRFRLEHVIVNFLSNAIKFSPEGSVVTLCVIAEESSTPSSSPPSGASSLPYRHQHRPRSPAAAAPRRTSAVAEAMKAASRTCAARAGILHVPVTPSPSSGNIAAALVAAEEATAAALRNNRVAGGRGGADLTTTAVPALSIHAASRPSPSRSLSAGCVGSSPSFGSGVFNGKLLGAVLNTSNKDTKMRIKVLVIDQGVGISPENQAKLFVPFAQIRSHELQQGRGTGLGLVLAKEIVEMHGGHVILESEEGKGSTFGFCVDLAVTVASPAEEALAAAGGRRGSSQQASRGGVLNDQSHKSLKAVDCSNSNVIVRSSAAAAAPLERGQFGRDCKRFTGGDYIPHTTPHAVRQHPSHAAPQYNWTKKMSSSLATGIGDYSRPSNNPLVGSSRPGGFPHVFSTSSSVMHSAMQSDVHIEVSSSSAELPPPRMLLLPDHHPRDHLLIDRSSPTSSFKSFEGGTGGGYYNPATAGGYDINDHQNNHGQLPQLPQLYHHQICSPLLPRPRSGRSSSFLMGNGKNEEVEQEEEEARLSHHHQQEYNARENEEDDPGHPFCRDCDDQDEEVILAPSPSSTPLPAAAGDGTAGGSGRTTCSGGGSVNHQQPRGRPNQFVSSNPLQARRRHDTRVGCEELTQTKDFPRDDHNHPRSTTGGALVAAGGQQGGRSIVEGGQQGGRSIVEGGQQVGRSIVEGGQQGGRSGDTSPHSIVSGSGGGGSPPAGGSSSMVVRGDGGGGVGGGDIAAPPRTIFAVARTSPLRGVGSRKTMATNSFVLAPVEEEAFSTATAIVVSSAVAAAAVTTVMASSAATSSSSPVSNAYSGVYNSGAALVFTGGSQLVGSAGRGGINQQQFQSKSSKFLLVDDTVSNCKMLRMLLSRHKIDCELAYDGQQAIDIVKDHGAEIDLIFMDHTMPVKNGLETTSEIRALGFPGLIIGLTGNALDDDVERFLQAGADAVYAKPFTDPQLRAILHLVEMHGSKSSEATRDALNLAAGRAQHSPR